jgi:amino acid transporter
MSALQFGASSNSPDEEKGTKYSSNSNSNNGYIPEWDGNQITQHNEPWQRRFIDSFKRDPNATVTRATETGGNGGFDHQAAAAATANSGLARKLKGRHMQMIAIGGSIGMSFIFLFGILVVYV